MRCFDNHSVVTFEELSQSGQSVPIKRNPNCPRHPTESFKYYCNTCQVSCNYISCIDVKWCINILFPFSLIRLPLALSA